MAKIRVFCGPTLWDFRPVLGQNERLWRFPELGTKPGKPIESAYLLAPWLRAGLTDQVLMKGWDLAIVTYSDEMVYRFRLRLAQTAAGELPTEVLKLTSKDIKFFYVEPDELRTFEVSVNDLGDLSGEYKNRFFEIWAQDCRDIIETTKCAFLAEKQAFPK